MTIARHTFDPKTGKAIFVTPDNPAINGLDAVVGSLANIEGGGRFFSKGGPLTTDWTEFALTSGFLPLTGGPLSGALTIGTDPGGTALLRVGSAATFTGDITTGGRILLTGSLGGLGGSTRYIGVGGSSIIIYHNVPSSGQHVFAVNEISVASITASNFTVAGNITASSGSLTLSASGALIFSGRSTLQSPADGQLLALNSAGTDFSRFMFGGITSAFPALRRTGSALEVVLADVSNYAPFVAGAVTVQGALSVAGFVTFSADNVNDIGSTGARVRNIYLGNAAWSPNVGGRSGETLALYANGLAKWTIGTDGSLTATGGGTLAASALTATTGTFTQSVSVGTSTSTAVMGFGNASAQLQYLNSPNRFYFTNMVQGPGSATGRDSSAFFAGSAGNSFIWGHANPDYRCAIGAYASVGMSYLQFYAYQGPTTDTDYRAGPSTRPSRMHAHSDGTIYFSSATTGAADSALSWTLGVAILPSGGINVFDITNGYKLNGVISLWRSTAYGVLNDSAGVPAIYMGGTTDLANYYRNGDHFFQSKDASVTYAQFRPSGSGGASIFTDLSLPTAGTHVKDSFGNSLVPAITSASGPSGSAADGTLWIQYV